MGVLSRVLETIWVCWDLSDRSSVCFDAKNWANIHILKQFFFFFLFLWKRAKSNIKRNIIKGMQEQHRDQGPPHSSAINDKTAPSHFVFNPQDNACQNVFLFNSHQDDKQFEEPCAKNDISLYKRGKNAPVTGDAFALLISDRRMRSLHARFPNQADATNRVQNLWPEKISFTQILDNV